MEKKIILIFITLALISSCSTSELERFKSKCESTNGILLNCETALAEGCKNEILIEGKHVICSCPERTTWDSKWDSKLGCIQP